MARLVPGAYEYARCMDASEYILGISALVELFNVIAGTFRPRLLEIIASEAKQHVPSLELAKRPDGKPV